MTTTMKLSLKEVFKKGDGGKSELFDIASQCANELVSSDVKHHQLRNLLDYVIWAKQSHQGGQEVALSAETRGRVATLRPRLAYMAARMQKLRRLQKEMDSLLSDSSAMNNGGDLARLYEFAAALVAFHKYYGEEKKVNRQGASGGQRR